MLNCRMTCSRVSAFSEEGESLSDGWDELQRLLATSRDLLLGDLWLRFFFGSAFAEVCFLFSLIVFNQEQVSVFKEVWKLSQEG